MHVFKKNIQSHHFLLVLLSFFVVTIVPSEIQAQVINTASNSFQIPHVEQAPEIDGILSPGEWSSAYELADLHESSPLEFSEPNERTIFWFMYTDDALYVSAYVYDDPEQLTATVMRNETSLRYEDRIGVILDPFNNKRSGYGFLTNPNGVRHESIYTSATDQSFDWATIWNADAQVVEDGWTAEMEIPFKSITFDPQNPTWGVNVFREKMATQTVDSWVSYNGQQNPSVAGEMTGFSNLNQGLGLDIIPTLSADYRTDHIAGSNDSDMKPSFDLTYKVTPALNLTLTWNTDFAATEVDDIQLDVGRFNTRFSEKRSFFLTDMDIFQFGTGGLSPLNTRTIGLDNTGVPVDITGGAKVSGRLGGYDIGTLIIRQEESGGVDATDIYVARVKHGLLAQSELGAFLTYGDPTSNDTSSTLGADFTYRNSRLPNNRNIRATFWALQTDNPGLDSNDGAWHVDVDFPSNDSWYSNAKIEEVQANFDPRLGFSNRSGVRQYNGEIGNNWIFRDRGRLQKISSSLEATQYNYLDNNDVQSRILDLSLFSLESIAGDQLSMTIKREKQVLRAAERAPLSRLGVIIPPGEYNYTRYEPSIEFSQSRPLSLEFSGGFGDYYTGTSWDVSSTVGWRPSKYLSFNLSYEYSQFDMFDMKADTRVIEFENVITYSPALSLVNLIQYENVSNTLGFNARLRWNLQSGQDIWFVLSHGMNDLDEDGHFSDVQTSATFKVRYTLRY
ncbi:MAG: hypothetical protein COA71_12955 [SAR86 cluster bacterium]|uniref:Hydrolase n=1 Tax=SAR86 cluster bacterium TaxID=2030880 RepID=A0A2A5C8J9_9GAMM|nr:MAG: hypothetical protein COA71_12955 [SAR86 cluster bacterium]